MCRYISLLSTIVIRLFLFWILEGCGSPVFRRDQVNDKNPAGHLPASDEALAVWYVVQNSTTCMY